MSRNAPLAWRHCQASHSLVDSVRRLSLRVLLDQRAYIKDVFLADLPAAIPERDHSISSMNRFFLERKGVTRFFTSESSRSLAATSAPPAPVKRRPPPSATAPHRLPVTWLGPARFRPPHKSPFGKPLLRQPVSLAVIAEQPDRRPAAAPKHEHTAGKRIFCEFLLAESRQRVMPFLPSTGSIATSTRICA